MQGEQAEGKPTDEPTKGKKLARVKQSKRKG
jgi:hypothetical protein